MCTWAHGTDDTDYVNVQQGKKEIHLEMIRPAKALPNAAQPSPEKAMVHAFTDPFLT